MLVCCGWVETDLLFLEAISSRSFLMSLRHFSISTTFIPSTEKKAKENVSGKEQKIPGSVEGKSLLLKASWLKNVMAENQSKNELSTHTHRQAKDIMVKLLKLPVTWLYSFWFFPAFSQLAADHSPGVHEPDTIHQMTSNT